MSNVQKTGKLEPQDWQLLKNIVADAMEQDSPGSRTALVRDRCGEDERLMAEAELLLKQGEELLHEPTDSLEECAQHATTTLWWDDAKGPGQRIGAYRVLREVARGGMGTVYLAARADGQFEKEVAIKVLKRGTDTDEVLRRFAAERHIVARLDHANIARLLDAGTTDDGLPYFVMEYVPGSPVNRFVREQNFGIPERLNLFLKITSAVEFAHQNHVIHRDLKPSNILVNSKGEPKLLDFGIAKLLDANQSSLEITGGGKERLTPNCASPEQLEGRPVTETTDVYALGVLLYEILSSEKPYKFSSADATRDEIRRVVCKEEPLLPSSAARDDSVARALRGDLDAITAYAMRKEPELRYASVTEFADDVRRHLNREPVLARQGTRWYRARTVFVRRRKGLTRLAAAAVIISLAASSVIFWSRSERVIQNSISNAPSKSIAVLPFDGFGDAGAPSYFVDGVHDNILTDLGKVRDLKVISRSGVAAYRGKPRNIKEIGRALGVANVLQGSVQVSGDRLRINTQLVDTRTDTEVWAEHYDRKMEDVFAVESELAQTIVAQLKATLSSYEKNAIAKQPTNNLQAYQLYMQAVELFHRIQGLVPGPESDQACELAREAIQLDSTFTRAYCLLNTIDLLRYRFGKDHTLERLTSAKENAEAALRTDPQSEEAQLALARYYYHGLKDYRRTEEELLRIRSTTPHTVEYYELASLVERRLGKWRDSIRDGDRAIELDPQNPELRINVIQTYNGLRRFGDSSRALEAAFARLTRPTPRLAMGSCETAVGMGDLPAARAELARFPDTNSTEYLAERIWVCLLERNYAEAKQLASKADAQLAHMPSHWLVMAAIAKGEGNVNEERADLLRARSLAEPALATSPTDPGLLCDMAAALAKLGETDKALDLARHAVELCPREADALVAPTCQWRLAEVLAISGQRDAAFKILSEVARCPFGLIYGDLKFNPMWDLLRDDPRFDQITAASAELIALEH